MNFLTYYEHIWLDDFRLPHPSDLGGDRIVWVKTYDSFVKEVKSLGENISLCKVHFDHDLGEEKSGYDCAKFLVEWCMENGYEVPDYGIQSRNPVGRKNIQSIFETYNKVKENEDH